MSLIESLRAARETPSTALHEFLTRYNPALRRVHIFVEGSEDRVFYRTHFRRFVGPGYEVIPYACGNKDGVYEVHSTVISKRLATRDTFWRVDKDLADLVREGRAHSPAVFVTRVYALENYFVTEATVKHIVSSFFSIRGVNVNLPLILEVFNRSLRFFHKQFGAIMAWVIYARRAGAQVCLRDVNPSQLCEILTDLSVRRKGGRVRYLRRVAGLPSCDWRAVRVVVREVAPLAPKAYVRGKFELWFLITFLKHLRSALADEANRDSGSVTWTVPIEVSNVIAVMSPIVETPEELNTFLTAYYPRQPVI